MVIEINKVRVQFLLLIEWKRDCSYFRLYLVESGASVAVQLIRGTCSPCVVAAR